MKYKFWPFTSSLKGAVIFIVLFGLFAWATDLFSQPGIVQILTFFAMGLSQSITDLERNITVMREQIMDLQDDVRKLKDGDYQHNEDYPSLPSGFDDA